MISERCLLYVTIAFIFILIILVIHYFTNTNNSLNNSANNKSSKEGFSSSLMLEKFANYDKFVMKRNEFIQQWQQLLTSYFKHFNQVNYTARGFKNKEEALAKYSLAFTNISNELADKAITVIGNFYNANRDKLSKKYFTTNIKFKIIKITNDFDGGYPQTHGNYMLMSSSWFNNPSPYTFIHEYCHILQRNNQLQHNSLYEKWGFEQYNVNNITENNFADIISRNRVNPDGLDINWIWRNPYAEEQKYYWIGAVYNSQNPTSLADVSYKWYELQYVMDNNINNGIKTLIYTGRNGLITELTDFMSYFGISNNHYHPNEIFAELVAKYFMNQVDTSKQSVQYLLNFLDGEI